MLVTLLGIVMLVRLVQPWNVPPPMLVTDSPMSTVSIYYLFGIELLVNVPSIAPFQSGNPLAYVYFTIVYCFIFRVAILVNRFCMCIVSLMLKSPLYRYCPIGASHNATRLQSEVVVRHSLNLGCGFPLEGYCVEAVAHREHVRANRGDA